MIQDEFSDKKSLSRQRKYQLRHQRDGLCIYCTKEAVMSDMCLDHSVQHREWQRGKKGCVKRLNSKSYRLQNNGNQNHACKNDPPLGNEPKAKNPSPAKG
jgi:hypothetical protein